MTQAELSRRVKGIVSAMQAAGLKITSARVTFSQGEPVIEVQTEADSVADASRGGVDVQELKDRIRARHAR